MGYRVYLAIYVLLSAWLTVAALRITDAFSIWAPTGLIMLVDFIYTRDSRWRFVLAAVFMIPIMFFGVIQIVIPPANYHKFIYRVCETVPFVAALIAYQMLFYRSVVRRREA